MLKVTIELAPFGNEDEIRLLSTFVIHNIGKGAGLAEGVYRYKVAKDLTTPSVTFLHKRSDGLHTCVERALSEADRTGLDKSFLL